MTELVEFYMQGTEKHEIKMVYNELLQDYFWGSIYSTVTHFQKYLEKLNEKNLNMAFELFWDGIKIE